MNLVNEISSKKGVDDKNSITITDSGPVPKNWIYRYTVCLSWTFLFWLHIRQPDLFGLFD